ncbi:hypothetical protein Ancab_023093 [Ancistrocladus abbreviatus]
MEFPVLSWLTSLLSCFKTPTCVVKILHFQLLSIRILVQQEGARARKDGGKALEGKVAILLNLLNEDPLILDRCCISKGKFATSALHVAAERGHLEFSRQMLNRKPELAEQLDSNKSSPLHLSSAKGRVEIVKALIIGGCERVNRNETVLHLCVKHGRLEALKLIVNSKIGDSEMLNARDDDGNSLLHKAVADKQLEVGSFKLRVDLALVRGKQGSKAEEDPATKDLDRCSLPGRNPAIGKTKTFAKAVWQEVTNKEKSNSSASGRKGLEFTVEQPDMEWLKGSFVGQVHDVEVILSLQQRL